MPEETMVASWRVMIVSSAALTRFGRSLMLHLHAGLLLVQAHDLETAGLELRHHGGLADAGDHALLGQTGGVDAPVGELQSRRRPSGGRDLRQVVGVLDQPAQLGGLARAGLGLGQRDVPGPDEPGE